MALESKEYKYKVVDLDENEELIERDVTIKMTPRKLDGRYFTELDRLTFQDASEQVYGEGSMRYIKFADAILKEIAVNDFWVGKYKNPIDVFQYSPTETINKLIKDVDNFLGNLWKISKKKPRKKQKEKVKDTN